MKNRHLTLATGAAVLAALAWCVRPADSREDGRFAARDQEARQRAQERGDCVCHVALAYQLAEHGRRTRSPMALVAAAELLHRG